MNRLTLLGESAEPAVLLVAFAFAGGDTPVFARWPRLMQSRALVAAGQYPRRGKRFAENGPATLQAVAEEFEEELLHAHPKLPLVLLGCSLGALVAYELAVRLEALGRRAAHLVVVSRASPKVPEGGGVPISSLPDGQFIKVLQERYAYAIPPAVASEPELLSRAMMPLRYDMGLLEGYRPAEHKPLACPITVCSGTSDVRLARPDLEAWGERTRGSCKVQMFPGGHFFFLQDPKPLLALLDGLIERTQWTTMAR